MDYREKIIDMVKGIKSEKIIKFIYWTTRNLLKRERTGE